MNDIPQEPSSKEVLTSFARLMVNHLSHDEIDIFCIAMLDANMKCRNVGSKKRGGKDE